MATTKTTTKKKTTTTAPKPRITKAEKEYKAVKVILKKAGVTFKDDATLEELTALIPEEKKEYSMVIKLNDQVFEIETDDIREAILSVKQEFLRTRLIIQITKGEKTLERMYYLHPAKMLFINKYAMDSLIKNLIF